MKYRKKALAQLACVKAFAKAKGMSDEVIAKKMGKGRPNVSRILSGEHVPRLDIFLRLCDAVGVKVQDLCEGK